MYIKQPSSLTMCRRIVTPQVVRHELHVNGGVVSLLLFDASSGNSEGSHYRAGNVLLLRACLVLDTLRSQSIAGDQSLLLTEGLFCSLTTRLLPLFGDGLNFGSAEGPRAEWKSCVTCKRFAKKGQLLTD